MNKTGSKDWPGKDQQTEQAALLALIERSGGMKNVPEGQRRVRERKRFSTPDERPAANRIDQSEIDEAARQRMIRAK
jgi:hypothetical protein